MESGTGLQERIGTRVRARRRELGLTAKVLAQRSGLSARFLSDVEAGRANISVGKLERLASAVELPLSSLLQPAGGGVRAAIGTLLAGCSEVELVRALGVLEVILGRRTPRIVALVGIRGAGKSTVGVRLAAELGVEFIDLTDCIESRAGMGVGDLFTLHGEQFYRSIELACFSEIVAAQRPCVIALPGGIVTSDAAMELLRESCTSVWLRATAETYWERVFSQGDTRPMAGRQDAMADLRALIARREPLYQQADLVVDTADVPVDQTVSAVLSAVEAAGRRP